MSGRGEADTDPGTISYFVASFLPDTAAERIGRVAARLPASVVPTPPERLHLTWRAFDGLPHGLLGPLKEGLAAVAARHGSLNLELLGAGVFPGGAVWARVCPRPPVLALQAEIDALLGTLGLPAAAFPFVPHITLGQGTPGSRPPAFLHDLSARLTVTGFALTTTGHQPYRVVRHFPLGT